MELLLSLLLFLSPLLAFADTGSASASDSGSSSSSGSKSYAVVFIIATFVAFVLLATMLAFYIRRYGNGCLGTFAVNHEELPVVAAAARGLHVAAIKSLPLIKLSEVRQMRNVETECAVCLSEFTNDDAILLLPDCGHVFHSDCIKPWLACHVTCPVCRASLEELSSSVSVSIVLDRISRDVAKPSGHHQTVEIEGSSI